MEQPPTIRALGRNSAWQCNWQNIGSCQAHRPAWVLQVVSQSLDPENIPNNTLEAPMKPDAKAQGEGFVPTRGLVSFPQMSYGAVICICVFVCLFVLCIFVRLLVCLFVCLFVCLLVCLRCSLACLGRWAQGETKGVGVGHCLVFFRFTHMVRTHLGGGRSSRYFRTSQCRRYQAHM